MVFTNKYTKNVLEKLENFAQSQSLKDAIELFADGDTVNIHAIFSGLSWYVTDELVLKSSNVSDEELTIYAFVEEIRVLYSKYPEKTDENLLDNAVCTCFLENLLNDASAGGISYSRFIPHLGEKSKEYCRAWDEFTGVKSPGLWDD